MRRALLVGSGSAFTRPLAYPTLTRYGSAPVLTRGGVGEWDHTTIDGESIYFDVRLDCWVMAYGGYNGAVQYNIGLAYSDDLLTWTKEATNPVFSANMAEDSVVAPSIVQVSASSYRLYYQTYHGTPDPRIYMATSSDLLTWTRANGGSAVLAPGTAGQWDDDVVFDPYPILTAGTTKLWYGGQKSDLSRGIGRATSSDGIAFTREGELFTPAAGESSVSYGAPAVLRTSDTVYKVFHDAALTGSNTTRFICREDTSDGSTFTHNHQVLVANPSGWDSVQVFDPAPIVRAGILFLFYAGSATTGGGTGLSPDIGLATMAWP